MHDEIVISEDGRYPITVDQGGPFALLLEARDANGDRISLVGLTGRAQVRERPDPASPVLLAFTVTVNQAEAGEDGCGEVLIECDATDAEDIDRHGVWDCRLQNVLGDDEVIMVDLSPVAVRRKVSR